MSITLVRHAESIANSEGLLCGQLDSCLTKRGVETAKDIKLSLKRKGIEPAERTIFCSPLKRAVDSMHQSIGVEIPFEKDARLMETNTGKLSKLTLSEVHKEHPWTRQEGKHFTCRYPEGESCEDVNKRMKEFIQDKVIQSNKHLLVFGHGGTLNHFAHILLGIDYRAYPAIRTVNTQVITLNYREGFGWDLSF